MMGIYFRVFPFERAESFWSIIGYEYNRKTDLKTVIPGLARNSVFPHWIQLSGNDEFKTVLTKHLKPEKKNRQMGP